MQMIVIPKEEELEIQPVEPGIYKVQVTNAELRTTKNNDPMLVVEYTIENLNRKVFDNWVLKPEVMWRINLHTKALGASLPYGKSMTTEEFAAYISNQILYHQAMAFIDVEEFEGQKRNRIKKLQPIA